MPDEEKIISHCFVCGTKVKQNTQEVLPEHKNPEPSYVGVDRVCPGSYCPKCGLVYRFNTKEYSWLKH